MNLSKSFILLTVLLFVTITDASAQVNCSKVPAQCKNQCTRFNNVSNNVGCWCSGIPATCTVDLALCTNAENVQAIALSELSRCIKKNSPTTPPTGPRCHVPQRSAAADGQISIQSEYMDEDCVSIDSELLEMFWENFLNE